MRQILLVTENFPPRTGGSGRWFWELFRRFPREQVVIAAGTAEGQEAFDRGHNLRLLRVPLSMHCRGLRSREGLRGYCSGLRALWPIVQRERPARILAGRCLPEGLMARALRLWHGMPYACFVHGEELGTAATSRELTLLTRHVLRHAEFVIANSRNSVAVLQDQWNVPRERVVLMHPGVDCERFVPAARDTQIRAELGWDERPVVLTVGRLQLRKGHDCMIRALGTVRNRIEDVLYAIVGEGEERHALEDLAAREGLQSAVRFHGELDDRDLLRCYQQCDLFALPNRTVGGDIEGFGMVLLEAQACGRPVLAGASGGTAETMRVPETGRVVPCDEPGPLADAVIDLLGQDLDAMGRAARQWVVEQFDWQANVQRTARVLL